MFAEDAGLLPDRLFQKMLEASRADPASFAENARILFAAMQTGGLVGFTRIEWFNGGLFDDDAALPLDRDDLRGLLEAAALDWSQIDPAILGTLFERGLDPEKRAVFTSRFAGHRFHVWANSSVMPDPAVVAITRDDDTTFCILHSRLHGRWSRRMGTSLEDWPRYTPSTTVETFPFPQGLTPDIPAAEYADDPRAQAIAVAAADLNEKREAWLNPPDLVTRVPEVVPGYPDRLLPVDEVAAKVLKTRTLTNLYNSRPAWAGTTCTAASTKRWPRPTAGARTGAPAP
jgi:hypothetical protein